MSDPTPGQILDQLGLELELDEGDLVESAVVVARVVEADGDVNVTIGHTDRMPSLDQAGLLAVAHEISMTGWHKRGDDE